MTKWINAKLKCPDSPRRVLMCILDEEVVTGYYEPELKIWKTPYYKSLIDGEVFYWAEIPTSPKGYSIRSKYRYIDDVEPIPESKL